MKFVATEAVTTKLWDKHGVAIEEAEEAWRNCEGPWLIDDREKNRTQPPTVWALAWTNRGRLLKIVVIPQKAKGIAVLRTAYEPDEVEIILYESYI